MVGVGRTGVLFRFTKTDVRNRKVEHRDVFHHSLPEGVSVPSRTVHLWTFKSIENPGVVSRGRIRP